MSIDSKPPEIRKEAFTKAREKLGLSASELAGKACLSKRQIEQIENGEISSFYGAQIKFTAAKKVARLLQLSDEDAFNYDSPISEKLSITESALPIGEAKLIKISQASKAETVSTQGAIASKDTIDVEELAVETQLPVAKVQIEKLPFLGTATKSKPTSQTKPLLWLSLVAAAVFSVINLRPLLLDKPEETVVVKEQIVEPNSSPVTTPAVTQTEPTPPAAVAAVTTVSTVVTDASGTCPPEEGIINYKPEGPRKAADMVYVQAKSKQIICVMDASGKTQNKLAEPGVGISFYGKPPFKVLTAGLNQVDIFFQGAKVRLSNLNTKTVILEASELVNLPADRTDSQLR